MDPSLVLLGVIVFAAHATQTMSGFGGMIICLTFGAHLYPIVDVLTLTVPLSLIQLGYVAIRHSRDLDRSLLFRGILPLMGLGLVVGVLLADQLTGSAMRTAFAILVLLLSSRELYALLGPRRERPDLRPTQFRSLLLGAGVIHGIYATGGPVVVYAVSRRALGKRAFRSTLTVVWLLLNIVLTTRYAFAGRFDAEHGWQMLMLLPAIPLGIWLGEALHDRVDERMFRIIVFALLAAAGLALLVS